MNKMKHSWLILFFFCLSIAEAQITPKIAYFKLQDVKLLNSPFKHAEDLNKQYLLEMELDRLLAPYLREAGLPQKSESYTNWENTGLDGHIGGHYLSGLSLIYASTGDELIKSRLDYMLSELKRCQDAHGNGYIGGVPGGKIIWEEIAAGNIRAGSFNLNGKWVPLYNIHKIYAGLKDAWFVVGREDAKEMLIKMTDWAIKLVSNLSESQIQEMLRSEHGGLNEIFADVAAITGNPQYLELAHKFSHQLVLNPLLHHRDELTGMHANTQIPKVLGFKRIAEIEANESWEEAARFFWETVVENRSVSIGGNSVSEHFNHVGDFSRMISSIEGPETCNTYNMLRLTKMMYRTSKDTKYVDYYERALYNHILSTQHPETGGYVYFTQMRPGHYRVYSQPHTSMWCCVGSGMENHSKYGEMIYAYEGKNLFVNLFIPSRLSWKELDTEIQQVNNFPYEGATEITVNPRKQKQFTLWLRYPGWVCEGGVKLMVNDTFYPVVNNEGYIPINRKWKKGDKVKMVMEMSLKAEQLPDKSAYYSFSYGPIVLAAKTTGEDQIGMFADDSRGGHIAHGKQIPLKNMPLLVGDPEKLTSYLIPVDDKPLTFRLTNLFPEQYAEGLVLVPFFKLHESRYIIYWPQATKEEALKIRDAQEKKEAEKLRLDAMTVDKVVCGEQQPESDHFIESNNSRTGVVEDIHWREANGWFSYQLKNKDKLSRYLYVAYYDIDRSRKCDILVNNEKIKSLHLGGDKGTQLQQLIIPVPDNIGLTENIVVKIAAPTGSSSAKIAEIRLLSQNIKLN